MCDETVWENEKRTEHMRSYPLSMVALSLVSSLFLRSAFSALRRCARYSIFKETRSLFRRGALSN